MKKNQIIVNLKSFKKYLINNGTYDPQSERHNLFSLFIQFVFQKTEQEVAVLYEQVKNQWFPGVPFNWSIGVIKLHDHEPLHSLLDELVQEGLSLSMLMHIPTMTDKKILEESGLKIEEKDLKSNQHAARFVQGIIKILEQQKESGKLVAMELLPTVEPINEHQTAIA